jgi:competence protein ComEC
MRSLFLFLVLAMASIAAMAQQRKLDIYWIDTEGGAATLIVTPLGHSMLVDAGNPDPNDRDAKRILEVAKLAGVKKIDILLTTHYHVDHAGGVPALAKLIPIERFYDHGENMERADAVTVRTWENYEAAVKNRTRKTVRPGEKIPLDGVDITVVSSNGDVVSTPLGDDIANPLCKNAQYKDPDKTENQRSVGFLLKYGKFTFLDLADLTWDKEMELACPVNKLGAVTLFQATHHGFYGDLSGAPALLWATRPKIVVVNNGASKGLEANAYDRLAGIPGVEGIWQLHRSMRNDNAHNTSQAMIANTGNGRDGYWIEASVTKEGKVTVTNARNNFSQGYGTD